MIPGKHGAIIINPTPVVTVTKRKNGKPTVLQYEGLRFVQDDRPIKHKKGIKQNEKSS
ncbi:hypothetical protein [Sporosarcina sp. P21c]|uniref:hypothetical protein n=1 Tax=Sporosarcina sp. P21c TaxID=2048255 RepID=UPI0013040416|nr:hypothetical protein [Sporosarcina sp. P21c]